jgi:hypothetical protein
MKMRRSLARLSAPESSVRTRSSADFIITTPGPAAHKSSVQAIADALIEQGTLDAEQIDHCIATAEAEDASTAEQARRRQWADTIANAESFKILCISDEDKNVSTH